MTATDSNSPEASSSSSSPWYSQRKIWIAVIACVVLSEGIGRFMEEAQLSDDFTGILRLDDLTSVTIQTSTTSTPSPSFGFYLFGDIPYAEWEEQMLQDQISALAKHRLNHTLFTVHVGDLQRTARSMCLDEYYLKIRNILRKGPLPTYVLAGDNDWYGELFWRQYVGIHQSLMITHPNFDVKIVQNPNKH